MGRTLDMFVIVLPSIAIGFGVPAVSIYYLEPFTATIISGIAVFFAFILGVVCVADGIKHIPLEIDKIEREQLKLLRAHQRVTLEEFDDIIAILKEIRDNLKSIESGT